MVSIHPSCNGCLLTASVLHACSCGVEDLSRPDQGPVSATWWSLRPLCPGPGFRIFEARAVAARVCYLLGCENGCHSKRHRASCFCLRTSRECTGTLTPRRQNSENSELVPPSCAVVHSFCFQHVLSVNSGALQKYTSAAIGADTGPRANNCEKACPIWTPNAGVCSSLHRWLRRFSGLPINCYSVQTNGCIYNALLDSRMIKALVNDV